MEMISPGWFIWHALIGAAIGLGLRVFEHVVWSGLQDEETVSSFRWGMMFVPLCFAVGVTLTYICMYFWPRSLGMRQQYLFRPIY
jgi:hypothetical protein